MKILRHIVIASALCGLAVTAARSADAPAGKACTAPIGRDLPTGQLAKGTLAIEPFVRLFKHLDREQLDVRAFLLLQGCSVVMERYKNGVTRDHNHAVYSVTKSVVSTLVGIQLTDGRLPDIDSPVASLMKRPLGTRDFHWERASTLTLRNVMTMSSGFAYTHNASSGPIYDLGTNRFTYALSQEIAAKPGERFNYSDADASITGAVVSAVADQDLYAFAQRALFEPLQMFNHDWWFRDAAGRYPGGWGLRMRPMDMLKLGLLYLQGGEWNGRRLFDAAYPTKAWTPGPSPRYGLHWWLGQPMGARGIRYYAAIGFKGQRIYVLPELGVVVAVVASLTGDEERQLGSAVLSAVRESVANVTGNNDVEVDRSELNELLRSGFRGVTRAAQSAQDTPRSP